MLHSIHVCCDFGSCIVYPGIAIGMIRVPVSIEQLRDRVRTKSVESFQNPCLRDGESCVDKKLAVLSSEHSNISSRAFQNADVSAKRIRFDCRLSCRIDHCWNNALVLRKQRTRSKHTSSRRETSKSNEIAAREVGRVEVIHDF